jgi:hypothetical protein
MVQTSPTHVVLAFGREQDPGHPLTDAVDEAPPEPSEPPPAPPVPVGWPVVALIARRFDDVPPVVTGIRDAPPAPATDTPTLLGALPPASAPVVTGIRDAPPAPPVAISGPVAELPPEAFPASSLPMRIEHPARDPATTPLAISETPFGPQRRNNNEKALIGHAPSFRLISLPEPTRDRRRKLRLTPVGDSARCKSARRPPKK